MGELVLGLCFGVWGARGLGAQTSAKFFESVWFCLGRNQEEFVLKWEEGMVLCRRRSAMVVNA